MAQAVWNQRRLLIRYRRAGDTAERLLEPLGVVLKSGVWYVVAARDGEVRTYRASRIESAELSEERFERPANFDLADYWTESTAAYERDAPRLAVLVRVAPDRVELLENLVGGSAMRAAERLEVPDDRDGWTHLRLLIDWPEDAAARLVGMGPDLEVIEPVELRNQILDLARGSLARHGVTD